MYSLISLFQTAQKKFNLKIGFLFFQCCLVEHCLEIVVESATNPFQSGDSFSDEVWGESDCYVQYRFPKQDENESKLI